MSEKKKISKNKVIDDDDKIFFGEKMKTCFACGQEVKEDTDVCPYCGTEMNPS